MINGFVRHTRTYTPHVDLWPPLLLLQHYTFYDLIVTKARGKSGPLFHFDVHEDVRLINDARIEKDEVRSFLAHCYGFIQ